MVNYDGFVAEGEAEEVDEVDEEDELDELEPESLELLVARESLR
ncbi:hypothetical protein ADILRU_1071 [Leifsonia rubra CMS 76R]|nr:hypothetical protein ADILRU_1071 [Leifsonia rubra CMS 76R]